MRKRDQFTRAVFVSIGGGWGGGRSTINIERIDSQHGEDQVKGHSPIVDRLGGEGGGRERIDSQNFTVCINRQSPMADPFGENCAVPLSPCEAWGLHLVRNNRPYSIFVVDAKCV